MVSQPSAPNPYATAYAQTQSNQAASQYNSASGNVNEVNPFGTVSYQAIEQVPIYSNGVISGYAPRYQRTTTLSPDQQKLQGLETQGKYNMGTTAVEQSAKMRDYLNKPMDTSNYAQWQTDLKSQATPTPTYATPNHIAANYNVDPTYNVQQQDIRQDQGATDRGSIEKAMMDSYNRSTAPTERAQEAQLAARGLAPGGAGYGKYQMQRDDNRAEAARQAYLASGNESRAAQGAYNTAATQRFGMEDTAEKSRFAMGDQAANSLFNQQNTAANSNFNQDSAAATQRFNMDSAAASQRFNMDQALASYYNQLRGAQTQEGYAARNQPINELTALMGGSQATIPQFQPFQGSPVQSANIGQYISDNYKAQSNAAAQTNAGLFGLAGAGVKGWFGS